MSDMMDLNPIMSLVEIKRKNKKEYNEMLKDIEEVTRDVIQISMRLTKEQRDQMVKDQEEARKKMKEEAIKNNEKENKNVGVN